jgi:hypothetical protein
VLETTERFLDWPDEHTFSKADLWQQADERQWARSHFSGQHVKREGCRS